MADPEIQALLEITDPMATWEWYDPRGGRLKVIFTLGILMTLHGGRLLTVELTDIHLNVPGDPWCAPWFRPNPFDPGIPFMPVSRFIALAKNGSIHRVRELTADPPFLSLKK